MNIQQLDPTGWEFQKACIIVCRPSKGTLRHYIKHTKDPRFMCFSCGHISLIVVWNRGAVPCQVLEDVQNHRWTACCFPLLDILVSQKPPTSQVISLERENEQHFEIPRVLGNQICITVS